jgi:signal transduction histidine kinase
LASTEVGTALFGITVLVVAVAQLRGTAGQTRRYRLYALYGAIAVFVGTTGTSLLQAVFEQVAGPALLIYQAALIAAAILLTMGLRLPSSQVIADLVVELDETASASPRDTLSRLLGDPLLQIGTGDTEHGFIDSQGERIELPDEDSDRIATLVERVKGDTTMIVHDRALASDGLLVEAVSTVARLSAANSDLNAQARLRLADLTASRRRLLLAEEDERRRLSHRLQERTASRLATIERSLLPLVRDGAAVPDVAHKVDTALEQLRLAQDDLAAIVHGLHPWESDGDLDGALAALAARTPIPVEVEVTGGPVGREAATAIYYVCSEAITNALKHAAAAHVHVEVHGDGEGLTVTVSDDGAGGADPSRGSGLRGLADRVAALGGELTVDSPYGKGTRLVGTLPHGTGT